MLTTMNESLSQTSSASRFGDGQTRFAQRAIVWLVGYNVHVQRRNVLAAGRQLEACFPAAAIDDAAHTGNGTAEGVHNGDDFTDRSSGCDDVLAHQNPFTGCDLEAATELHRTVFTFGEHGAYAKLPSHFLPNDNASECRRDDGIDPGGCKLFGDDRTQCCSMLWILQDFGALNIVRTVQTGSQLEMSFQQCVCLLKEDKKLFGFSHGDG